VAVNSIYASIIPSYKYNLVLKSFSYGTQVMGHPVHVYRLRKKGACQLNFKINGNTCENIKILGNKSVKKNWNDVNFSGYKK
jgi:hypothetical protein